MCPTEHVHKYIVCSMLTAIINQIMKLLNLKIIYTTRSLACIVIEHFMLFYQIFQENVSNLF